MRKYSVLFAASTLLLGAATSATHPAMDPDEVSRLVRFLISDRILTQNANANLIPLSFYVGTVEDIAAYFGDYLCTSDNTCSVIDTIDQNSIDNNSFAILGRGLIPLNSTELEWRQARAQLERTTIKYGSDIYHAATWQIALALAAENGFLEMARARKLIANQLETLTNPLNRAIGSAYRYGGKTPIVDSRFAFAFRWLATQFYNKDPFYNSRFQNFISSDFDPSIISSANSLLQPPSFYSFVTTWSDYKPLTGKNAWAQLIGPLQAEYLLNKGTIKASSPALINAINSLTAFSLMQTGIGAFYYAPVTTGGLQAIIPPTTILIEDNFAVLAGLQI